MSYITEQNQPPGWYPESTGEGGGSGGTDLAAVDVFVGDYLSATDLIITTGAVNRYQRYLVGN